MKGKLLFSIFVAHFESVAHFAAIFSMTTAVLFTAAKVPSKKLGEAFKTQGTKIGESVRIFNFVVDSILQVAFY